MTRLRFDISVYGASVLSFLHLGLHVGNFDAVRGVLSFEKTDMDLVSLCVISL